MTFKNIKTLARQLLNQYGLPQWHFQLDRAKRRAGCCKYNQKTITLSKYYIALNKDNEKDIIDTLKHEIAHALAGWKAGHNKQWKAMCRRLGAKPERCYDKNVKMPEPKLIAQCPQCSQLFKRHRRPRRSSYCVRCGPIFGRLAFTPQK